MTPSIRSGEANIRTGRIVSRLGRDIGPGPDGSIEERDIVDYRRDDDTAITLIVDGRHVAEKEQKGLD